MNKVLVSTVELEDMIHQSIMEAVGSCYSNVPGNIVNTMVDHYNRLEVENLLDAVIGHPQYTCDSYQPAEAIVYFFTGLVAAGVDVSKKQCALEFSQRDSTIIVTIRDRMRKESSTALLEEYRHGQEQWDYYPERLQRAFGEIESLLR